MTNFQQSIEWLEPGTHEFTQYGVLYEVREKGNWTDGPIEIGVGSVSDSQDFAESKVPAYRNSGFFDRDGKKVHFVNGRVVSRTVTVSAPEWVDVDPE